MVMKSKEIDTDRFYRSPKSDEKIYSHYTDGSEISLSVDQKKKAEEFKLACIAESIQLVEADVKAREKPLEKRGRSKKEDKIITK